VVNESDRTPRSRSMVYVVAGGLPIAAGIAAAAVPLRALRAQAHRGKEVGIAIRSESLGTDPIQKNAFSSPAFLLM
jgi:hypothetical protein